MIYCYLGALLLLLVVAFLINKKDIVAPSFVFTFGFVFQGFWVFLFHKQWRLNMHLNTFLVIILGIAEFIFVNYIIKYIINRLNKDKEDEKEKITIKKIKVNKVLEVLYLIFSIGMGFLYLYLIVKAVGGKLNGLSSISDSISTYDSLIKFSDDADLVRLPSIISNINIAIVAAGYWFIYVLINNFLVEKKISIIEVLIVIVALISSMLGGSRTPAFMMVVAAVCYYVVLFFKKRNYTNIFSVKMFVLISALGVGCIAAFIPAAKLLGRNINGGAVQYLSIYCGAEVKNLDTFLQEKDYRLKNELTGSQTFYSIMQSVGNKLNVKGVSTYRLDLPFRKVDNIELGNVYTTFYAYIYDFGYVGLFVFVLLMGLICGLVYETIIRLKKLENPKMSILVYGVFFGCLVLSFFSNKFFEELFSMGFIKKLFVWYCCTLVFCKIDYKKLYNKVFKK